MILIAIAVTSCNQSKNNGNEVVNFSDSIAMSDSSAVEIKTHPYINSTINVDENNVPIDKNEFYFPLDFFPELSVDMEQDSTGTWIMSPKIIEGVQDTFVVRWYSKHLYAMKEPLLFNKNLNKEVYRFTWLRTFDNPVVIRIENIGNKYKLIWKLTDGAGGYEPGNLIINKSSEIKPEEWEMFKSKLDSLDYWNMNLGRLTLGDDGSEWILEGVNKDKYNVVTVWSPSKGKYYEVCNYLLSLTDLEITENEKY